MSGPHLRRYEYIVAKFNMQIAHRVLVRQQFKNEACIFYTGFVFSFSRDKKIFN